MTDAEKLIDLIERVTANIEFAEIRVEGLSPEYQALGETICAGLRRTQELCRFIGSIADGELECKVPERHNYLAGTAKDLYYKLKHLTWQAEQVAKGDYSQQVDFLGSFSASFNTMIRELEHREKQIREQAEQQVAEAERRNNQLRRQMEHQLSHYHAYEEYVESFRSFRERYKQMMGEVYALFGEGKYEEGRLLIARINDTMGDDVVVHKEYSNHEFINAALTDIADICRDRNIPTEFLVHVPAAFYIKPEVTVDLITSMSEYVLAMLAMAAGTVRDLSIVSSQKGGWLTVRICLSAQKELPPQGDTPQGEYRMWADEVRRLCAENNILLESKMTADRQKLITVLHINMH